MQKVLVTIKTMIKKVMKKEPVLSIAVILAVISMFVVHPDDTYVSYIDFRTLAILFCLMVIVAGMREIGVFDYIAQSLLNRVKSISGIPSALSLRCPLRRSCACLRRQQGLFFSRPPSMSPPVSRLRSLPFGPCSAGYGS